MADAPKHICHICRKQLTYEKHCERCSTRAAQREMAVRKEYDKRRGNTTARGYGHDWAKIRNQKLSSAPLCEMCEHHGVVNTASVVHHINPVEAAPNLRLRWDNLMSLCRDCHEKIHDRKK